MHNAPPETPGILWTILGSIGAVQLRSPAEPSRAQAPKDPEPPPAKTSGIWSKIVEPK